MRIGLDAKWFFEGNPSGRVVVRRIVERWLAGHPEHEYVLFLRRKDRRRPFPFASPKLIRAYVPGRPNLLANLVTVPPRARRLGLDAGVFFNFVPLRAPYRRIAFINDAIFLSHPEYFSRPERLYFASIRYLARRADRVATLSESEKSRLAAHGVAPPEKISVVPLGVEASFRPRAAHPSEALASVVSRYGLPERFLLYVGRLNRRKNIGNLLDALSRLDDPVPLVLVGAPDGKASDPAALIRRHKLGDRVIRLGRVRDEDLPALYALAHVFCFVSFEEGFGLPALEAMASGVPVLVSERPVFREVCADAALFVDPADPAAIASALSRLLRNPAALASFRETGPRRAALFTWERAASRLLDACREVLR